MLPIIFYLCAIRNETAINQYNSKTMKKILFGAAVVCAAMLVACGGGKKSTVTKGSLSGEFDSLSYSLGANIGYGMGIEMADIPFNYEVLYQGIDDAAFQKTKQTHEEGLNSLRDYFMTKRGPRAQAVARQRAEADSIRLASGDSTKVEYAPDPSMFLTEGERDSISYAFGSDIGYNVIDSRMPVQIVWLVEGMKDMQEGDARMDQDEVNQYLQYYFMVKRPAQNKAASEEWLASVEKQSGVKKTESGLLYKIEKPGDPNTMATDNRDEVFVHYKGTTRDGEVFDASRFKDLPAEAQEMRKKYNPEGYDEDKEAHFRLDQVIKGWTEGIKLVGEGGKITLWIPSDLAYGQRGSGRAIGPNEALRFDVEVVDVVPYEEPVSVPDSTAVETTVVEME